MTFVVNMTPVANSGETNQDSEPNLSIDPANPNRIVASSFTPDPLGGPNAPIFVSLDGGATWVLNSIVPSLPGQATGDISVAFGHDGRLYAGILRIPGGLRLNILRTTDVMSAALMTVLVDRTGSGIDQPFVEAARVFRGPGTSNDRVYVGNNDFNGASGRTATVDVSLDGAGATPPPPANFQARRIEVRATSGQDLPPIRPAVHIDGTIYAAYVGRRAGGLSDVVVVRDDNWAQGATQFSALLDSGDGLAGQRVVTGVTLPFENFQTMGMERLVASDLSIAVDPRDSARVWVAWGDRPAGTTNLTVHARLSTDRGQTWSADLRTVANAKAPALAVNSRGRVAFLYQQLTGAGPAARWVTQVDRTSNDFAAVTTTVLATVPATTPAPTFLPYLGDYVDMKAVGKDFCGVFSASNTPSNANFPNGVTYQRNANFGTQTLFAVDGITAVPASIDPFFFRLTELAPDLDFYVADWTDNATSFDLGVEPSVRPVFYAHSDVWTRRTNAPGGFDANNRPQNEDPQNGSGPGGDNFAFARIRRRAAGSAGTVTAHFLTSEFGTGSNYVDAGVAPDIAVNFAPGDSVLTMSGGYPWHLDPTSSTHFCLAVELSSPTDPIVAPSLLGRAPGWPTTDLLVVNDNNKAQRNMGVGPLVATGFSTHYAVIHNAATYRRDMVLQVESTPKLGRGDQVFVVGERARSLKDTIIVRDMAPGENRWLCVHLAAGDQRKDVVMYVNEVVGNTTVNGFGIAAELRPGGEVSRHLMLRTVSVLTRLAAQNEDRRAAELAEAARKLAQKEVPDRAFFDLARASSEKLAEAVKAIPGATGRSDSFGLQPTVKSLTAAMNGADLAAAQSHYGALVEGVDALLTYTQKLQGDLADVGQNVRWTADLFRSKPLSQLRKAKQVVEAADRFVADFSARKVGVDGYPGLVRGLLPMLKEAASELKNEKLRDAASVLGQAKGPLAVQLQHREYLSLLAEAKEGG